MFKIAYGAGHIYATAGRRLHKSIDPNQTREWTLNDRVARYFAEAAKQYEDVELLRVDDPEGKKNISLAARCAAANNWRADFCLAIHHDSAGRLFSGGGITSFSCRGSSAGERYRDAIYESCIAAGGLRGDRSNPKVANGFYVLKHTDAPAVLMEFGFMDSTVDGPVIITEAYSKLVAYATMEGIAKVAGLKKKEAPTDKPAEKKEEVCSVNIKVLKKGAKGAEVKALQILLIGYGFSCGSYGADGDFGSATDKAVRAYQKAKGLSVDGICGPMTWNKLLGVS